MRSAPVIITLSGPEGSGKSTNQAFIIELARSYGLSAIAVKGAELSIGFFIRSLGARLGFQSRKNRFEREIATASHAASATTQPAACRRTLRQRVRSIRRACSYAVDSFVLRIYFAFAPIRRHDVIVIDRYIYDALSRIVEEYPRLARCLDWMALRPHVAFVLSGDVSELVERRPSSTPEYYTLSLQRFRHLGQLCPHLLTISPGTLEHTHALIRGHLEPLLLRQTSSKQLHDDSQRQVFL